MCFLFKITWGGGLGTEFGLENNMLAVLVGVVIIYLFYKFRYWNSFRLAIAVCDVLISLKTLAEISKKTKNTNIGFMVSDQLSSHGVKVSEADGGGGDSLLSFY